MSIIMNSMTKERLYAQAPQHYHLQKFGSMRKILKKEKKLFNKLKEI